MKNSLMISIAAVAVGAAIIGLSGKRQKLAGTHSTYSPYERR